MVFVPPQTSEIENIIIRKLNDFIVTGQFTEFEIRRLKQEVEKIKEDDLSLYFALLGSISSLEKDTNAMHSYFDRALQQSGGGDLEYCFYSIALKNSGFLDKAYDCALKAYEKSPLQLRNLDALIRTTALRKNEFKRYAALWKKQTEKDHYLAEIPEIGGRKDKKEVIMFQDDHPEINEILDRSKHKLISIFDSPLTVLLELVPNTHHELDLVAWIQCLDGVEEGMEKFFRLQDWYIDQDFDRKTDCFSFNIEFVEQL